MKPTPSFDSAQAEFMSRAPSLSETFRLRAELIGVEAEEVELGLELLRLIPELAAQEREAVLCLVLTMFHRTRQGHTRLFLGDPPSLSSLSASLAELWGEDAAQMVARTLLTALLEQRLSPIVRHAGGERSPLVIDGAFCYFERIRNQERRVGQCLAERIPTTSAMPGALTSAPGVPVAGLTPEQAHAIQLARTQRFVLISGGPGAGKTSLLAYLLEGLVQSGVDPLQIALAAPTGKAAQHQTESLRARAKSEASARFSPAETLHRLLGFLPDVGRFRHHPNNPLPHDVVIVDETSMIDLALMDALLLALKPEARLIMLGDADQLPSVEAGAVMRELTQFAGSAAPWHAALTHNFRMNEADPAGRSILEFAKDVNRGELSTQIRGVDSADRIALSGVEHFDDEGRDSPLDAFYREWYTRLAHRMERALAGAPFRVELTHEGLTSECEAWLQELRAAVEGFKLLCVTRQSRSPRSAESANEVLHRHHARVWAMTTSLDIFPGEPVMITKNDYERRLFNGDQGLVLEAHIEGHEVEPFVFFPSVDRHVAFRLSAIRHELVLAHALTVHKAQGSEYDHAALVLPERENALSTRELVYTAVTRARRSMLLVGPRGVLESSIRRKIERESGLLPRPSMLAAPGSTL